MIDLVMWLIELKPISVYAIGNKKLTKDTVFKKNSFALLVLEFPNNILVKITANGCAKHNHFHDIKIFSKDKTLINSSLGAYSYDKKIKKIDINYPDKPNRKKLIQNFIDCLLSKKTKPVITLKEQINLMSVCFAADESIKKKKKIKIKYL